MNYQNSKIYKLIDSQNENKMLYIGSTASNTKCQLAKRLWQHKSELKLNKHGNKNLSEYLKDRDLNDIKIVLIEEYKCDSKIELLKREDYYINLYKDELLNIYNAYANRKEYLKEYNEINKEKLKEYRKEYYKDNIEKRKEYYKDNIENLIEKMKAYNFENDEKIKKYQKEYREKNKEKTKEYKKEYQLKNNNKHSCDVCNYKSHLINHFKKHLLTKNHLKNVNKLNTI